MIENGDIEIDIDTLEAELQRLRTRPYAEIGVPMYLAPEDLTGAGPGPQPDPDGARLGHLLERAVRALEARRGPLMPQDLAGLIEVIADRTFLDRPFSALSEVH